MGAGQSSESDTTKHVFTASTPLNFSPELVDSLQSSSETNSTRAKTLDLHIAQRVHEELERIQKREQSALEAARQKVINQGTRDDEKSGKGAEDRKSGLLETTISAKDLLPERLRSESDEERKRKEQTSAKVQQEIENLQTQLGQRKVLKELPKEVEQAREGVISCLRLNDRKPLDCWKEVEIFKREVKKLEEEFVNRVL